MRQMSRVDSPFFSTIVLFNNQLFPQGLRWFLERRMPGKNGTLGAFKGRRNFKGCFQGVLSMGRLGESGYADFEAFDVPFMWFTWVSFLGDPK